MKKIITSLALVLGFYAAAQAQFSYITYNAIGENPYELNKDVEEPAMPGWATALDSTQIAEWSALQTIPFTFSLNGTPFTQYKVSSTGVVTFTTSAPTAPPLTNAALPDAAIPDNSICVWGLNLKGINDKIRTRTFGTTPNRQYWIQWNSASHAGIGTTGWAYWAIVLEETTNYIYIVDQRSYSDAGQCAVSAGVQVNSTTAFTVAGSPNLASTTTATAGNGDVPDDNTYYHFYVTGTVPASEVQLKNVASTDRVLAPGNVSITYTIINRGTDPITSLTAKYETLGNTTTGTVPGINVLPGTKYQFTHTTPLSVANPTRYPIDTWVELSGDPKQSNDSSITLTNGLSFAGTKRVLFEEGTGTWCGWCPRGSVFMDLLHLSYPSTAMLVAVHNSDPMTDATYDVGMGNVISGYPSGLVDRKSVDVDPSTFVTEFGERIAEKPFCNLDMWTLFDAGTRQLTVNLSANFATDLIGDYRFNAVVVEDSVTGSGSAWDQVNYYSDAWRAANGLPLISPQLVGAGHNWNTSSNPVSASTMVYDHVGRSILGGFNGTLSSLPSNILNASAHAFTYNYTVPPSYDIAQMHVVGWVSDGVTGRVLNANKVGFSQVGINEIPTDNFSVEVYPNPMHGADGNIMLTIKNKSQVVIEIFNGLGQLVHQNLQANLTPGEHLYPLSLNGLAKGIYNVKVSVNDEQLTKRIVLE